MKMRGILASIMFILSWFGRTYSSLPNGDSDENIYVRLLTSTSSTNSTCQKLGTINFDRCDYDGYYCRFYIDGENKEHAKKFLLMSSVSYLLNLAFRKVLGTPFGKLFTRLWSIFVSNQQKNNGKRYDIRVGDNRFTSKRGDSDSKINKEKWRSIEIVGTPDCCEDCSDN